MTSPSRRSVGVSLAWLPHPLRALRVTPGIQTRILVPLLILMLLSLLGSTAGFLVSTGTTRNQLLDGQLADDTRRLTDALKRREQDVLESAQLLARDSDLIETLRRDTSAPDDTTVLNLDRRAVAVRDRFQLDQVVVLNARRQVRVNLVTRSALSQLDLAAATQQLGGPGAARTQLMRVGATWLLLSSVPVQLDANTGGTIITALDIEGELERLRRELELPSDIQLFNSTVLAATRPSLLSQPLAPDQRDVRLANNSYRVGNTPLTLGAQPVQIAVLRSEDALNTVVTAGFQVMLASSGLTLLLVMIIGVVLARSLTRPIQKLARVAQAVAAGDLSQRAELRGYDEIGQLGQTLDQATTTITRLLDQQAQNVGELHAILQSMADGVLAIDSEERLIIVNPIAATLLGRPMETLIGRRLNTLLLAEQSAQTDGMQRMVALIRSELAESAQAISEEQLDLSGRTVRLRSAPIIGGEGLRLGVAVVLHDVTAAIAADRAKSDFIAIASHELRTPLTSIKGHIDLLALLDTTNLRDEQRDSVATIQRQSNHMITLVNDLLEMARIEQDGVVTNRAVLAPLFVIETVLAEFRSTVAQRRITIHEALDANLPALWMDFIHLRRVLSNLVSNAIKYTNNGGAVTLRAYTLSDPARLPSETDLPWLHPNQHSIVFEVEDTGVGIRAIDQPRVFTRFFRAPNPRTVEAGGTGLGLTITRALVQMNGGQIGFRSVVEQGSCFWVRFPVSEAAQRASAIAVNGHDAEAALP